MIEIDKTQLGITVKEDGLDCLIPFYFLGRINNLCNKEDNTISILKFNDNSPDIENKLSSVEVGGSLITLITFKGSKVVCLKETLKKWILENTLSNVQGAGCGNSWHPLKK